MTPELASSLATVLPILAAQIVAYVKTQQKLAARESATEKKVDQLSAEFKKWTKQFNQRLTQVERKQKEV